MQINLQTVSNRARVQLPDCWLQVRTRPLGPATGQLHQGNVPFLDPRANAELLPTHASHAALRTLRSKLHQMPPSKAET
jgi:hypothetical protein